MGEKPRTIVLLSGGMNSATMLYDIVTFAKAQILDCMIFDAYQPTDDVICARMMCEKIGLPFSLWDLEPAPIMTTTHYDSPMEITKEFSDDLRNTCFMQMIVAAVRYAKLAGANTITAGFCDQDVTFILSDLQGVSDVAARMIGDYDLRIETPLWPLKKWEIFKLAEDLNRTVEVLGNTHSCLSHDTDIQHPWGHGCGSCDGCVRRWRAWEEHLERIKA